MPHPSVSTSAAAMKSTICPVLDDDAIKELLERMKKNYPDYEFDTSFVLDGSCGDSEGGGVIDLDPDSSDTSAAPACDHHADVEAMRIPCASGDLLSVKSVFQTYWLDRPVDERIDKGIFGASGLCEAIKCDDALIGSYLLTHILSINTGHFAMATEYQSYLKLQLFIDHGWDINTSLSPLQPPAFS